MRYKIIKIIISVFVALLCSVLLIGAKYYVKTVQSFKTFYNKLDIRLTSMQNDSYNELKKSLDNKYANKLEELLGLSADKLKCEIEGVLGKDYILLREEFYTTINSIEGKKREFTLSNEYLDKKENLSKIKNLIDNSPETEKDKYLEEFRVALNDISTLNTKLNNQLKGERDRLNEIKIEVKNMFIKNANKLLSIRKTLMAETRTEIANLLKEYTFELNELNSTFNVKSNDNFGFDFLDITRRLKLGKLENECFSNILTENAEKSVDFFENTNKILS